MEKYRLRTIAFVVFLAVGYTVVFSLPILSRLGMPIPGTLAMGSTPAEAPGGAAKAEDITDLKNAIEHFRQGMVERRPEWIIETAAPDLTFGHSNGVVQTREEFAEVVRSGAEIFKRVDLTNKNLVVSGNTAVERHHFSADIIYEGKLMNFELEVVEIWQKTDRWRLLARQAVKT